MPIGPIIFASAFILIGIGLSIIGFFYLRKAYAVLKWPRIEVTITKSEVLSWYDDFEHEYFYSPNIEYEFLYNNVKTIGHKVGFVVSQSTIESSAEKVVDKYPEGAKVLASVNPKKPTNAVLEPSVSFFAYAPLGVGVLIILIASGMLYSLFNSKWE